MWSEIEVWLKKQLGTVESPSNSNNVIYNTHFWGKPVSGQNFAWCAAFVYDAFLQTNNTDIYLFGDLKSARKLNAVYCPNIVSYAKEAGKFITSNYKTGDVLLFNFDGKTNAKHVGFAIADQNGQQIKTIEGNTASDDKGDQSNGGGVFMRTRNVKSIIGAFRPEYKKEPNMKEPVIVKYVEPAWGLAEGVREWATKTSGLFNEPTSADGDEAIIQGYWNTPVTKYEFAALLKRFANKFDLK